MASRKTIREYAESLAIAFVMAMILRHFVLEAYRIPSASMFPMLVGKEAPLLGEVMGQGGDRILVSKFAFATRPPKAWEIVVFKMDEVRKNYYEMLVKGWSTRNIEDVIPGVRQNPNGTVECTGGPSYVNYVKRVVGLPGQEILIRGGDVYLDGQISRKPLEVMQEMLIPVANDELRGRRPLSADWAVPEEGGATGPEEVRLTDPPASAPNAAPGERWVSYRNPVYDDIEYPGQRFDIRRSVVPDLQIAFKVTPQRDGGAVLAKLVRRSRTYVARIPVGTGAAELRVNGEVVPSGSEAVGLAAGAEHSVRFSDVDGRVFLVVDGQTVITYDDPVVDRQDEGYDEGRNPAFGVSGSDVVVRDVALARDVYYTSDMTGHRFAVREPYRLGPDEYFMLGDNSPNSADSRYWGVVPQENLVGSAFCVFWPPQRWKFVY